MFRAKEQGGDYQFFEHGMQAEVKKRLELESELRRAIETEELVVYYQPQLDIATNKVVSMEALIRWRHPDRGLILPSDFIPLAEETGLITSLGEFVLRTASAQLRSWLDRGFGPLHLAVNLSGRQLERAVLRNDVDGILEEVGLEPGLLELEITESAIMRRAEDVIPLLHQLKEMGITLTIDDFGTGYSSLNYLKRFPIDLLKIDRSFVRDINTDPADTAIIRGIIALAQSLGLKVVAEGVETRDQMQFLRAQSCDKAQGLFVSRPMPAEEFEKEILARPQQRAFIGDNVAALWTNRRRD
jgi:EAL domain-containing protein (putative c-di-GMP-specific phosphodiesterase class I)